MPETFDVNEWRLSEANARLHELFVAAGKGELSDALTGELGTLVGTAMDAWHAAVRAMVERREQGS